MTKHQTREQRIQASFDRAIERVKEAKKVTIKEKYKMAGIKKIGYLDIESSGLVADFDIMLSYGILVRDVETGKTEMRHGVINKDDVLKAMRKRDADLIDHRILVKLLGDISDIDCLLGHWFVGKFRHDIPFIRTRCAINKIEGFPAHKTVRYGDTQKFGSLLYRLHSNGLKSMASMFNISTQKTEVPPKLWKLACLGDKKALDYVLDHNLKDCIITYKVHKGLENLVGIPNTYA